MRRWWLLLGLLGCNDDDLDTEKAISIRLSPGTEQAVDATIGLFGVRFRGCTYTHEIEVPQSAPPSARDQLTVEDVDDPRDSKTPLPYSRNLNDRWSLLVSVFRLPENQWCSFDVVVSGPIRGTDADEEPLEPVPFFSFGVPEEQIGRLPKGAWIILLGDPSWTDAWLAGEPVSPIDLLEQGGVYLDPNEDGQLSEEELAAGPFAVLEWVR